MKRKHLEMTLSSLDDVKAPRVDLEQYRTPSGLVCDMLYNALEKGNIEDKTVMELGCGSAPFAIGASLLGASKVYGVDMDSFSLETARDNLRKVRSEDTDIHIEFIEGDISDPSLELPSVDTILMNPPFGAQKRHADRPFIERALSCSDIVYSIHNGNSFEFIKKLASSSGVRTELLFETSMILPHRYSFHRKEKMAIDVIVLRYSDQDPIGQHQGQDSK